MREDSIIVFVEGDPTRAALQFQRMKPADQNRTFWVKTVLEAIDMLKNYRERLDIVSMGYNLNGEEYNHPSREDCGLEIVRFLEKADPETYAQVRFVIHSWDAAGVKMADRLRKKGYLVIRAPFGS